MKKATWSRVRRVGSQKMRRGAFTLIELLIVIAIIGLLIAVAMAVGGKVLGSGKSRVTEDLIRVLDTSVGAYEQEAGSMPPAKFTYVFQNATYEYAIVDGREVPAGDGGDTLLDRDANPATPSLLRYSAMCKLVPGADSLLKGLNTKFVRNANVTGASGSVPSQLATGIEVLDAWGRPIRMVHPTYDGGYGAYYGTAMRTRPLLDVTEQRRQSTVTSTIRRSFRPFNPASPPANFINPVGDADEGICPNRRPYFYSAGPDGDPGKREDNVYTTRPTFPQETSTYSK